MEIFLDSHSPFPLNANSASRDRRVWRASPYQCFTLIILFYELKCSLFISTEQYTVEIYTPDKNVNRDFKLTVRVIGVEGKQTEDQTLVPTEEKQGYVSRAVIVRRTPFL